MQTPTHILVAAALFARPAAPRRNALVFAAALLPDLSIFVLFGWARLIRGATEHEVWRVLYWQEPWQLLNAVSNSFPLWGLVLAAGLVARRQLVAVFAGAGLMHLALDFPVHNSDAHRHFWPLSDWRFHSPLSYWDQRHNGDIVGWGEIVLALALMAVLAVRFGSTATRVLLSLAALSYVAVPAYFRLMLHAH